MMLSPMAYLTCHTQQTRMAFNPAHKKIKKAKHKSEHVYTSLFMAFKSDEKKIIIFGIAYIEHGVLQA